MYTESLFPLCHIIIYLPLAVSHLILLFQSFRYFWGYSKENRDFIFVVYRSTYNYCGLTVKILSLFVFFFNFIFMLVIHLPQRNSVDGNNRIRWNGQIFIFNIISIEFNIHFLFYHKESSYYFMFNVLLCDISCWCNGLEL